MVSRSLITRVGILVLLMALLPSAHLFARKPGFDERALAAPVMRSDDEPALPTIGDPPQPDTMPSDEALPGDLPSGEGLPMPTTATFSIADELLSKRVFLPLIVRPIPPLPDDPNDWLGRVNGYRLRAGVPPV
ncbi:MAG: CAP domain-containing protein, partial [Roseiflexus sp.]